MSVRRLNTIAAVALCAAAASAAGSASAVAGEPAHSAEIELRGSHGFRLVFLRTEGYLLIGAGKGGVGVLYVSKVREPESDGIQAQLGKLGTISLRFRPAGPAKRLGDRPEGCVETRTRGAFVGRLTFRGELGYTAVDTRRARGSVTASRGDCQSFDRGPIARTLPGFHGRGPVRASGAPRGVGLFANHRDRRYAAHFACSKGGESDLAPEGARDPNRRYFEAAVEQHYRGIAILRMASAASDDPATFTYDEALTSATAAPPPPFSGSAMLARGDRQSEGAWTGSLAVDLPGAPATPLAGPAFTADMTFREPGEG